MHPRLLFELLRSGRNAVNRTAFESRRRRTCGRSVISMRSQSRFSEMASSKIQPSEKGILELLADGPVVGDGSMCMTLEKRGYATAGVWTPEAVVLYPDAVRQLLREYLRAGADVLQTPCYYASDGKLRATTRAGHRVFQAEELNAAACKMARDVANEGGALVCGGVSPVMAFWREKDMDKVREEFENQIRVMVDHGVDFLIGETFAFIEELEICVEVMKRYGKPIACTMRIGGPGDESGVSLEECTVRMARTGADIIGLNCQFDLNATLKAIKRMKAALEKEGLDPYLIVQPMGWMAPETENVTIGYLALPDFPLSGDGTWTGGAGVRHVPAPRRANGLQRYHDQPHEIDERLLVRNERGFGKTAGVCDKRGDRGRGASSINHHEACR